MDSFDWKRAVGYFFAAGSAIMTMVIAKHNNDEVAEKTAKLVLEELKKGEINEQHNS